MPENILLINAAQHAAHTVKTVKKLPVVSMKQDLAGTSGNSAVFKF